MQTWARICAIALLCSTVPACESEPANDDVGVACENLAGAYLLQLPAAKLYTTEGWLQTVDVALFLEASCDATLTHAFRPSVHVKGAVSGTELVFEGQHFLTVGNYPNQFSGEEYRFDRIKLPRQGGDAFAGTVEVTWEKQILSYDVGDGSGGTAVGTVTKAGSAPTVRVGPADVYLMGQSELAGAGYPLEAGPRRRGLPDAMMPWEPLQVAVSEPVPGLAAAVTGPGPFDNAVVTSELTAKDVWAWMFFDDWDAVRGTSWQVNVPGGLQSLGGIALAQSTATGSVFDPGPAAASHEFDGTSPSLGTFGDVVQSGGHIVIKDHGLSSQNGIAGRLSTSGKTKVLVDVSLSPQMNWAALHFRVSGHAGHEYPPNRIRSTSSGASGAYSIDIQSEAEVGFTLTTESFSSNLVATIERVWAE